MAGRLGLEPRVSRVKVGCVTITLSASNKFNQSPFSNSWALVRASLALAVP